MTILECTMRLVDSKEGVERSLCKAPGGKYTISTTDPRFPSLDAQAAHHKKVKLPTNPSKKLQNA